MFQVLVVEPDGDIRSDLTASLKGAGYRVFACQNSTDALDMLDSFYVDLMITGLLLPNADGCTLIRELRDANFTFPILVVSVSGALTDKQAAIMAGADDYIVKPFEMTELLLRVYALLRRAGGTTERQLKIGEVTLEYDKLAVITPCETIVLPQKEFYVLFKLLSYPQQVFTRQQLMDEIWGLDARSDERTVDVHIKRLREKLEHIPEFEIVTIRGLGYKAVKHSPQPATAAV